MAGPSIATREHDLMLWEDNDAALPSKEETMSFSLSWNDDFDDDSSTALIALPPPKPPRSRHAHFPVATARTPLNPSKRSNRKAAFTTNNSSILFGPSNLDSRQEYKTSNDGRPTGLAGFFFGFMYEEPLEGDEEEDSTIPSLPIWNRLNRSLFLAYGLSSAAASVPVTLVPFLDFVPSTFVSTAAASAVLGTACGKFLNGPMADIFGARRVSTIYGILLALSLLGLSFCQLASTAAWALFFVEIFQSVQWPCIIIILAAHYNNSHGMYEGGIYVTCLASRLGALLAIPLSSLLLRSVYWRTVAQCGALVAIMGSMTMFLLVQDSPSNRHLPQNPIHVHFPKKHKKGCAWLFSVLKSLVMETLIPSIKEVLKSGTFWIVAIAHTGGTMVRSSNRILGTYFYDTTNLSFSRAAGLAVMIDFGILLGLGVGGNAFSCYNQRQRKRLVARLYMLAICACYLLAFLAIPKVRNNWMPSNSFLILLQILAVLCAGIGVAVQCFHIPGIVGATFGHNKGLYAAYTDGVAYGLGSIVWRIVGGAVEEGNPKGGGWAYGWAAVALLVVLCAVLMVEFMEHYFCRSSGKPSKVGYETIIFV